MASAVLLLISLGIPAVYCGSHILEYRGTLLSAPTPGMAEYSIFVFVDGILYGKYNSDVGHVEALIPIPFLRALSKHLELMTRIAQDYEGRHRHKLKFLMGFFNKTKGDGDIHVYQRKAACELHDDGSIDGYDEIAFDGKEFLAFDKERVMHVPVTQEAVMLTHMWNKNHDSLVTKNYMEIDCIQHMKTCLSFKFNKLAKKVPPNVKISSSESESGTKLHCWVYGFYPRDVEVKWIKNERDEIYSEESPEILPNPDGIYQIRVSVEVTPEEGATYSCHVDHSSLEKTLVVPFEFNNGSRLYIIPASVASLLLLIILGVFIYRNIMTKDPKGSQTMIAEEEDLNAK